MRAFDAVGQVISFAAHDVFPVARLAIALNSALPPDISARDAVRAAPDFSARLSAIERAYAYVVLTGAAPSAVLRRYAHHEYRALDVARMRAAALDLAGTHDFISFCGVLPERGGTERTIASIAIESCGPLLVFRLRANGFLHRMVRIAVGTLLEIGSGRRAADAIPAILAARDRRAAGLTAPPNGLFLTAVALPRLYVGTRSVRRTAAVRVRIGLNRQRYAAAAAALSSRRRANSSACAALGGWNDVAPMRAIRSRMRSRRRTGARRSSMLRGSIVSRSRKSRSAAAFAGAWWRRPSIAFCMRSTPSSS